MDINIKMSDLELKDTIKGMLRTIVEEHVRSDKGGLITSAVSGEIKDLRSDKFFSRVTTSAIQKAVFDRVNRHISEYIDLQVENAVVSMLKKMDLERPIKAAIDAKVKNKLRELLNQEF